ncbi:hypothetical protein CIL05_03855 [Virgibacillus profundi]|uniref:DUF1640 domain-containing protein n=1 Tax=Virgibacillus profundi TaxID=2024555 RepID=A0A2A2IHY7_9BACI|nr:hypothetical protein [Virgibacillus profundi]PAV30864.1 hypothetical protein CIL05_03855 [Virgibacillus profundi]PXY55047.1 hypothetical protein CIT14_03935 [Virgibacillus profundi]
MDKQILDLLTEMNYEMKSMKTEIHSLKSEMHHRFDTIEAKLEGSGGQFEITNDLRINEMDFIDDKIHKMEKELFILKNKHSN